MTDGLDALAVRPLPVTLTPSVTRAATPELLALGKRVYDKQCAACHGAGGKGDGEAAYLLYPKPRDFVMGNYRNVSTWERVATDEDLYLTISRGMPGSAMPSWGHLPEGETGNGSRSPGRWRFAGMEAGRACSFTRARAPTRTPP